MTEVTIKEAWKWKQDKQLMRYFGSQTPLSVHSSNNFTESKHIVLLRSTLELKVERERKKNLMKDMI